MACLSRPGIYSGDRSRFAGPNSIAAVARWVQIKSQISKGHLCAWLDNHLRLIEIVRVQLVRDRAGTGICDCSQAST